jgi:hypothetical protein
MKQHKKSFKLAALISFVASLLLLFAGGCARYARNVNELYLPSSNLHGKSGEVYIVIPESQQTKQPNIKWVLGSVKDADNIKIDELYSPRSSYELVQRALALELQQVGFKVFEPAANPASAANLLYLSKVEFILDQVSSFTDINVSGKLTIEIDQSKNGQFQRQLRYSLSSSRIDVKDRDLLARNLLKEMLQSAMLTAVPDIVSALEK